MGVMCSLLGHDYDDPDVERERNEEGTEVVLTAKRVERCRNCGHERTIAENTEVTALSAAAGVVREPDGTVVVAPDGADTAGDQPDRFAPDRDGPGTTEHDTTGVRTSEPAAPRSDGRRDRGDRSAISTMSVGNDGETDGSIETVGDDGADSPATSGGSIADSLTARSALGRPTDGTAGSATEPRNTDGKGSEDSAKSAIDRIHDAPTTSDRPHRAPGEWPAEPGSTDSETAGPTNTSAPGVMTSRAGRWPGETDRTPQPIHDGGADGTAAGGGSRTENEAGSTDTGSARAAGDSFACGSCEFSAAVADSPLRAGDICPDCGVGYLALETRKG